MLGPRSTNTVVTRLGSYVHVFRIKTLIDERFVLIFAKYVLNFQHVAEKYKAIRTYLNLEVLGDGKPAEFPINLQENFHSEI